MDRAIFAFSCEALDVYAVAAANTTSFCTLLDATHKQNAATGRGRVVSQGDIWVAGRPHQQPGLPALLQLGCQPFLQ